MNNEEQIIGNRRLMILALWVPLMFTLVLACLAYQGQHTRDLDSRWILHTYEAKNQLEHLNSLVKDIETTQRSYLLTADTNFLALYEKALKEIPGQSRNLTFLIVDNPKQVTAAAHLQHLITDKLAIAAQTVSLARQGNFSGAIQIVKSGQGKRLMDDIRLQVDAMVAEEDQLLTLREKAFASQVKTQGILMTGLVSVDVALIVGATFLMQRLQKSRHKAETRTGEANTRTEQAEVRTKQANTRTGQAEAQFIEAQKMEVVGQLASGVAHDFNNILAVIMGYSDLILLDIGTDGLMRKYAEEIRHATARAAGLTRQLLIFSRKQTVQSVVLDLNARVKDLDKMMRRLIGEHMEMILVPGKEIGRIKTDAGYVGQVLMNLVVNARDAMPNGGKLTIATSNITLDENYVRTHAGAVPGDYVMLSVSDTGTGMTDDVKAHMFEAFFTTKSLGKGTGLGLTTCQTIVQQSGGHIDVHSEIGKGTTFKIFFPRVEQPLDVMAGSIETGLVPRGTETLLVVEDEPSVRHMARGVLKNQGYEVLSAANGQDALHVAREHKGSPIRLVVTDVIMPLMGGKVMAEWLKATYPGLKILFTSGYTDDAIAQHGVLEAGVEFLSKPYTPAALGHKVREMLDR